MTSIYDIHEAARDCDVEGLRRCLTPPFVRCPSTAVVTATGRHAKVLQHQSPDLLYVELDGNENAEGPAFERKTIRAGAEISSHIRYALDAFAGPHSSTHAEGEVIFLYFQKVIDAGGFKKYAQAHLATLTKTFAPKFPVLPPEMVRHILTFGFHAGFY